MVLIRTPHLYRWQNNAKYLPVFLSFPAAVYIYLSSLSLSLSLCICLPFRAFIIANTLSVQICTLVLLLFHVPLKAEVDTMHMQFSVVTKNEKVGLLNCCFFTFLPTLQSTLTYSCSTNTKLHTGTVSVALSFREHTLHCCSAVNSNTA